MMFSPATMRLVGLLRIVVILAGCGERAEDLADRRAARRLAARDATVVGTWAVDEVWMREAFASHLAVETEVYSANHDEAAVIDLAKRQARRFEEVLRSFEGSLLTVAADKTFRFHAGFVWGRGAGTERGTSEASGSS